VKYSWNGLGLMQHFCSYMFSANYHELCI